MVVEASLQHLSARRSSPDDLERKVSVIDDAITWTKSETRGGTVERRTIDHLVSTAGLLLVAVLSVAGGLLLWGHNYIDGQVTSQLSAQKIVFPTVKNDPAIAAPQYAAVRAEHGAEVTTGAQAEVYANVMIGNDLKIIAGGKTYAQLATEALADPSNAALQAEVVTVFQGTTLRGLLLNAFAFGTMGQIAGWAALAAFIGAGLLLVLSLLGLVHARRASRA